MSLIFKASLPLTLSGRKFILQTNTSIPGILVSRFTKNTKQIYQPLFQARAYSSKDELVKEVSLTKRERIYDGGLATKIRFVKMFSLFTSASSLSCQPYIINRALEAENSAVTVAGIIVTFGFFAFVTPLMLHVITKRYVVHVDYDHEKDTYIATTYSIFAKKKETEFTPADVQLPQMTEMMTTCMVKGAPMFMDARAFTDINHYKRIMGFDKPMDFGIKTDDVKTVKN